MKNYVEHYLVNFSNNRVIHIILQTYCPVLTRDRFSTFYKNNFTNHVIRELYANTDNIVEFSNYVQNDVKKIWGIVHVDNNHCNTPSYLMKNSIFLNNNGTLFYVTKGTLTILNCKIFHPLSTITIGNIIFTNNSIGITSTFNILHYNTFLCYTDIPIKTNEQTLFPSNEETLNPTLKLTIDTNQFPTNPLYQTLPPIPTLYRTYPPDQTLPPIPTLYRTYPSDQTFQFLCSTNNFNELNNNSVLSYFLVMSITSIIVILILFFF